MESEQSSFPLFPAPKAAPSTCSLPTRAQKRLERLHRNRAKAKCCRQRKKAKVASLESEVAQLSELAKRLQAEASALQPVFDGSFGAAVETFFRNIESLLRAPGNHDTELTAALTEAKEVIYSQKRIESMRTKFQNTVELMVPEILYCSLNIRPEREQRELPTAFHTLPYEQQQAAHRLCLNYWRAQKSAIGETLETLRIEAAAICQSVDLLYTVLEGLQPPASARQAAAFALWLSKYYMQLPIEKVLNYGHNSTEMLSRSNS